MGSQPNTVPDNLAEGVGVVVRWLKQSWLRLNPSETEILWLGRGNLGLGYRLPVLDSMPLTLALFVRNMGKTVGVSLSPSHECCQAGISTSSPSSATDPIPHMP